MLSIKGTRIWEKLFRLFFLKGRATHARMWKPKCEVKIERATENDMRSRSMNVWHVAAWGLRRWKVFSFQGNSLFSFIPHLFSKFLDSLFFISHPSCHVIPKLSQLPCVDHWLSNFYILLYMNKQYDFFKKYFLQVYHLMV